MDENHANVVRLYRPTKVTIQDVLVNGPNNAQMELRKTLARKLRSDDRQLWILWYNNDEHKNI